MDVDFNFFFVLFCFAVLHPTTPFQLHTIYPNDNEYFTCHIIIRPDFGRPVLSIQQDENDDGEDDDVSIKNDDDIPDESDDDVDGDDDEPLPF